jgi:hypothetical protein
MGITRSFLSSTLVVAVDSTETISVGPPSARVRRQQAAMLKAGREIEVRATELRSVNAVMGILVGVVADLLDIGKVLQRLEVIRL